MVSGGFDWARRVTQVSPRLRIAGVVASPGEVPSTVPASAGALEAMER